MEPAIKKELTGIEAVLPLHTSDKAMKVTVPALNNHDKQVFKAQNDIVFADENCF